MTSFTNVFGGEPNLPSYSSYSSYTIDEDISLNWPSSGLNTNKVLSAYTDINATAENLRVELPNATQVSVGQAFYLINKGATSFFVVDYLLNDITEFLVGNSAVFYLTDNTTTAGTWGILNNYTGVLPPGITFVGAESLTNGLTITGAPITNIGTLQFSLSNNLVDLSNVATPGFSVYTGEIPTVQNRILTAGNNILIQNASGVAGNPLISMNPVVNNLISVNTQVLSATTINNPGVAVAWIDILSTGVIGSSYNVLNTVPVSAVELTVNFLNPVPFNGSGLVQSSNGTGIINNSNNATLFLVDEDTSMTAVFYTNNL